MSAEATDHTTDATDQGAPHADPGPMPTPNEEAVAEENAKDVDLDAVEENYREMTELGANVKGEGEIG